MTSIFYLCEVFLILVASGKGQPHRGEVVAWLVACSALDIFDVKGLVVYFKAFLKRLPFRQACPDFIGDWNLHRGKKAFLRQALSFSLILPSAEYSKYPALLRYPKRTLCAFPEKRITILYKVKFHQTPLHIHLKFSLKCLWLLGI